MVRMSTADPRFLCSVFQIIVCPFVFFFGPLYCLSFCFYLVHDIVCPFVFIWSMILSVLRFVASDYSFNIFKLACNVLEISDIFSLFIRK